MTKTTSQTLQYIEPASLPVSGDFSEQEHRILAMVNQKVAGRESLDAVMHFLFEATREVCPCDRIGLAFIEEDGQRAVARWSEATYEPVLLKAGYAEDLSHSSLKTVLDSGRPRIISDLERYLAEHPQSRSSKVLIKEGVRSSMTSPLYVEDRPVALLFRSSRRANVYTEHQLQMHLAVAERLSQAVEKAYRIERLAAANQAYSEMLGFVSHELKNPLASMVMDAKVLTEGYLGTLEPAQRDKIGRIVSKADYLLGLVREYLDLARVEDGQLSLNVREVDYIETVIGPCVDIIAAQLEAKHMHLVRRLPQQPLLVQCDPNLLKIVLTNLLGNAVKYGKEGGQIELEVAGTGSALVTTVWNEGPGFGPDQQSKLFRKFSRLDEPELKKQKGTGVGLYTAWRIVNLHGGVIRAESEPGQWARFRFEIPQPIAADRRA